MSACGRELPGCGPDTPSLERRCKKPEGHNDGCGWWPDARPRPNARSKRDDHGPCDQCRQAGRHDCPGRPCDLCKQPNCPGAPRFKGTCPNKGTHDRGAFGALLAEAKALGCNGLEFYVRLTEPDDAERWDAVCYDGRAARETGRTGEEALRRLVEDLRAKDEYQDTPALPLPARS